MFDRFDTLGPFALFAKLATGLAIGGVGFLVVGIALLSPMRVTVPPATLLGMLLTGTGGGLVLGAAVTYVATGDAARRHAGRSEDEPSPD